MKLLFIALGGASGAVLRYTVSLVLPRAGGYGIPWATITVNLVGSFCIGMLGYLAERSIIPDHFQSLILIGLLGAFTTFSTFMFENLQLIQARSTWLFAGYLILSNVAGLLLVLGGYSLGRHLS